MFLGIGTFKKKVPNYVKSTKKEGFKFHVIRTLSFFLEKK